MKRRTLLLLWGALALAAHLLPSLVPAPSATADFPKESPATLSYRIQARLDAKTHEIDATGQLTWRNDSPVPVTEMRLHLYLNAFKNERSTFMRESSGNHRGHRFDKAAPGWIDLQSFRAAGNDELIDPAHLEYVHEDDGNADDETVVRIPLRTPIPPGEQATFDVVWKSRMPRVFARTGVSGNGAFFMVAQWYPKPGVWQEETVDGASAWRWNCHQFHGSSEFYADYGSYDVDLTVPKRFEEKVGASGKRVDMGDASTQHLGRSNADGTVTYRHKAENVHDFAWVCGEDFAVSTARFAGGAGTDPAEQARIAAILGVEPKSLDLPEVEVYFLLQPEHLDQLERHKMAVFHALTYMGFWFGPYPYPTLTVVDPDHRGRDAGGMEYPTLITGGTRYVRAERQLSPEGVLIHEFGHQHFYGLVGTNEFRHAWMDEGMNTYGTAKVLMKAYEGYAPAEWYGGFPHYGQRAFAFAGLAAEARKAVPFVKPLFDDALQIPFGDLGLVKSIAGVFGAHHPPEKISLWGGYGEVTPLSFLREIPPLTHLQPLPSTAKEWERSSSRASPVTDPIAGRRAWEYMSRGSYGANSYGRTASSLRTLEGYLGEETMVRVMHTYCQRYRFQHPEPKDFFGVVTEVAHADGKGDVGWLLDELFERATEFDFGIESVDSAPLPGPEGEEAKGADAKQPKIFESTVLVRRYGGVRMPIDVRLSFADGSVRDFRWDRDDELREYDGQAREDGTWARGALQQAPLTVLDLERGRVTPARGTQQRWAKIRLRGPAKLASAEVDPFYAYGLDRDRTNDGRSTKESAGAALQISLRALGWVEMSHSFYGGL